MQPRHSTTSPLCRCRLSSSGAWRELRGALALDQAELAGLIHCSEREIRRLESDHEPHRCPFPAIVAHLRYLLREPVTRAQLVAAGVPNPYPEDAAP